MPGNRFPFAVGVGCQIDLIGFLRLGFQFFDGLFFIIADAVGCFEIVVDVNAQAILSFNGQIADMSLGGNYFVILTQVFFDCF